MIVSRHVLCRSWLQPSLSGAMWWRRVSGQTLAMETELITLNLAVVVFIPVNDNPG